MTDMTQAPGQPAPEQATAERNVPALAALRLSYRVVLRQLTSVARIVALTLLALVSTVAAFALGLILLCVLCAVKRVANARARQSALDSEHSDGYVVGRAPVMGLDGDELTARL